MLVIFDCDGVLVDSEALAAEVFSAALNTLDITMSAQECFSTFHGMALNDCYAWIEKNKNIRLPADFPQYLERATQTRFSSDLRAVHGVEAVLKVLARNKIPSCVASNGGHKKIKNSLSTTGLLGYFDAFFSAEDVGIGKPNPALFLYAAKKMGIDASEVIVVEDSFTGFTAAMAANMKTVLYRPNFLFDTQLINDSRAIKINAMSELLNVLKTQLAVPLTM